MTSRGDALPKLLPCPFCGGDADFGQQIGGNFVNCSDCLASTNVIMDHQLTKEEAAKAWNTRAMSVAPPAEVTVGELKQYLLVAGPCSTERGASQHAALLTEIFHITRRPAPQAEP